MSDPWFKFYPADWKADSQLKLCSTNARAVWIEMLCICHEANPYGHYLLNGKPPTDAELSVMAGIALEQIAQGMGELESRAIFSRTAKGVIYSRKLVRDEKRKREGKKHGKKRWEQPNETKDENTTPSGSPIPIPSTHIPDARTKEESKYAFDGKVIRLNRKDWNALMTKSRMSPPAFETWICGKDDFYSTLPEHERAEWWQRLNNAVKGLNR